MSYEAKTDWKYDDLVTEKDMNRIEQGLKDAHVPAYQPLTLNPGLQVVEVENDTPFRMGEVKGRTLVNLLGRAGGCEDVNLWADSYTSHILDSTNKTSGSYGMKVSFTGVTGSGLVHIQKVSLKAGKYYVALVDLKNSNAAELCLNFNHINSTWATDVSKFTPVHIRLSPSEDITSNFHVLINGETNCYGYMDSARLYEITEAEYNAIGSMTPEQVAERYPYVDSMTNIKNPYAIVTGGNLLPPFYEWTMTISQMKIASPYHALLIADGDNTVFATDVRSLPDTQYVLSAQHEGNINIGFLDGNKNIISLAGYTTSQTLTVTTPPKTEFLRVYFSNLELGIKTYTISNPMLNIGTEPKPFTPQQRSMVAFEAELASHPIDGSNPDTLFMGDDGLPYVLEPWKKVTLDGSLPWIYRGSATGFKWVGLEKIERPENDTGIVTKYTGVLLERSPSGTAPTAPDQQFITGLFNNKVYDALTITISNTDSGWGPDYKPEPEEIKLYFMGWRMAENVAGFPPYNGTGTKCWYQIITNSAPQTARPTETYPEWTPYRLQYLKAKPTVEPVRNYELGATLSAGSNMVEVGSGIVIREKANPQGSAVYSGYYINETKVFPTSKLAYEVQKILGVYKHAQNNHWVITTGNAYGNELAFKPLADFDPTAVYRVTYTMLDPTLAAPISGTVAANLRGTVSDLVQEVGDIGRRLSVVENSKAEKDSPPWITPTLLNGWVSWGERWTPPQYYKDDNGIVHLRGLVKGGVIDGGKAMFVLPKGYRPSHSSAHVTYSQGAGVTEANGVIARIDVSGETGSVYPTRGSNELFSLEGISFRAER
ncbi:hypothetical protein ABD76_23625 [Paenibacillus dendritiformis]|uniref:hypothetical protein n=1 Tax=Paenibacillus dendritiformis TaxID=130049 RepID=UPI0018CE99FE|nr:hypothetical protein [Paenibacillus dendritiformis]MBG9795288.1 hypothetical protein [Paenibacillus dendritiformis]